MENTQIVTTKNIDGTVTEHVVIEHADGSFTSMLKSTYDAQVEHLTSPLTDPTA